MIASLLLVLAAQASAVARDDADGLLVGRTPGPPARCIAADRARSPVVTADGRILYREPTARRVWVTRPLGASPRLDRRAIPVVRPSATRLCRGHPFRIVTSNIPVPSASCRFGSFVPFEKR